MSEFELIRDGAQTWDVVVVGGGTAGLSGALNLARARRSVLVIDKGEPRNAPAAGAHGVLGRLRHDAAPLTARRPVSEHLMVPGQERFQTRACSG
ncbi:FAD-dependent oxidoreductase [Streptomyces lydicus]|uniref:FAD-dependent oxidoreductase n=1 Tax=Streptomyces lydicus TaxID=47763 RepID=UPI0036E4F28D